MKKFLTALPLLLLSGHLVAFDTEKIEAYLMAHQASWWQQDLDLLMNATSSSLWTQRQNKAQGQIDLSTYETHDPDGDPNHLFYYWNDTVIQVPVDVATKVFSSWMDLAHHWTKETKSTTRVYITESGAEVWRTVFSSGLVGVRDRELIAVCLVSSGLNASDRLISCRSLPDDVTGREEDPKTHRINWHGAFLLRENDYGHTMVRKIDRENLGGSFPAWLLNMIMPRFLNEEVLKATSYINAHASELICRFNEG